MKIPLTQTRNSHEQIRPLRSRPHVVAVFCSKHHRHHSAAERGRAALSGRLACGDGIDVAEECSRASRHASREGNTSDQSIGIASSSARRREYIGTKTRRYTRSNSQRFMLRPFVAQTPPGTSPANNPNARSVSPCVATSIRPPWKSGASPNPCTLAPRRSYRPFGRSICCRNAAFFSLPCRMLTIVNDEVKQWKP